MATTWRIVYHWDDETIKKDRREFSLTDEIMELINSWWGWGWSAINWVKVNWQIVNPDQAWYVWLTIPWVINNLASNSTTDALSAKQWKVLYEYIQALQHVWHFLALWNTATWLPVTNPETSPYTYNTWDYYIVSNVAAVGWTNYKPNGSSYTINVASTTVESWEVQVNDLYFYDWYERRLLDNSWWGSVAIDTSLSTTSTNPVQNQAIANAINNLSTDVNTKTFYLASAADFTNAQAAVDWIDAWKMALVCFNWQTYVYISKTSTKYTFEDINWYTTVNSNWSTWVFLNFLEITLDNGDVDDISISSKSQSSTIPSYLATWVNYSPVYTPEYNGSPATKKYVDDKFSAVPVYTAGSNIDITSNQISTIRNWYVYVTCTDAASTRAKTWTSAEGNYTPQEWDLVVVHFVNWCSVSVPTISIDWWTAIPFYIWLDSAHAGNMYLATTNTSKMFIYTDGKLVWDAVKDNNTTYSAWTGLALNSWVFSNTWVLSVNGQTWAVSLSIPEGSNVKAFFLEDDEDTTTAQAAIDWANEWNLPLLVFGAETYTLVNIEDAWLRAVNDFEWIFSCDNDDLHNGISAPGYFEKSYITISTSRISDVDTVTSIEFDSVTTASVLTTWNSSQTFTPSLDYDPSTKKYVDDKVAWAISAWTAAPSSPSEWQLWYDTTNDVLKVYNWTAWVAVWWWWGVAITDVTVSTAYSTAAKVGTTTWGSYTPAAWDLLLVNFVNWFSTSSAPTLAIDSWTAYNIRVWNTAATSTYFSLWTTSSSNVKVLMYFDWTYYKVWSTQNTTYSGMSQSTASTGTSTSSNLISAKVLNDTIAEKAITLDPSSPLTVTTIRCWTETQYTALTSKWPTTAYLCVEE